MKKLWPWARLATTILLGGRAWYAGCAGLSACLTFCLPLMTEATPVSFQQAVADYNGGKYSVALSELDGYKKMYPTNALVHYYSALCHQALNHLTEARTDYQYVAEHGDARLQSMSRTAIDQLSRLHSQGSSSVASVTPSSQPRLVANAVAHAKVKRILEFSADW